MEGLIHLRGRAAEIDLGLVRVHVVDREALGGQPRGDRGDIAVDNTECVAELLRRQPFLKLRRFGIVLVGDQLLHRGLAHRTGLQHQLQVLHCRRTGERRAGGRLGDDVQMRSGKCGEVGVDDGVGDARCLRCIYAGQRVAGGRRRLRKRHSWARWKEPRQWPRSI